MVETPAKKPTPQKYESKYEGAMPSFELGGGSMQPKYDVAGSPTTKFEPKYEPNLSMENSNSNSIQAAEREMRTEAPPRNILVAPENNSISMTLMQ